MNAPGKSSPKLQQMATPQPENRGSIKTAGTSPDGLIRGMTQDIQKTRDDQHNRQHITGLQLAGDF